MIEILEKIQIKANSILNNYKHKKILFIGSESYDGCTITILEGLQELGYTIYTYKKNNINSWFCNTIIEDIEPILNDIDFVLSNLHWGTRWNLYKNIPKNIPRILIDADDNPNIGNWELKFKKYYKQYNKNLSDKEKDKELSHCRWIENIGDYKPDKIFTSQKPFNDNTIYIPFGIQKNYLKMNQNIPILNRKYDFTHISGPGQLRCQISNFLSSKKINGKIFNGTARGEAIYPEKIKNLCKIDNNIHSYHRWSLNKDYFNVLNNSKVLIYHGIDNKPFWDSKRPWEALACGCILLYNKPLIDTSQYPLTQIDNFLLYNSLEELVEKCNKLINNPELFEKYHNLCKTKSIEFFSNKALTNYFLKKI